MKILIVSCVFPPEPVVSSQISKDLAISLKSIGNDVTVLAPDPSRPLGFKLDYNPGGDKAFYYQNQMPGIEIIHLDSYVSPESKLWRRFLESYSFGQVVSRFIKKNGGEYDLVYINSWPVFSQYLIARACRRIDIKYVMHIQDIYPESLINKLPRVLRWLVKLVLMPLEKYHLKHASKVIVISDKMKALLIKSRGLNTRSVSVVYNWQDEKVPSGHLRLVGSEEHKFTFTYLGNIGPIAGVETLIRAFHLAEIKDTCLVIAGSGARKQGCMELANSFPNSDIRFIAVPAGQVALVQQQADVLLLPVIKGGALSSIPSKLPSYMFSAKPILATLDLESDTARAILDASCGWVGEAEDVVWLANMMKRIYTMTPVHLHDIGENGFNYCTANFSKSVNLQKLVNQIVDDKHHSS
ncbi:MAG: glycosyltransferase family 4 protein [Pyrinomonadaceae bacterium]|nr:glycosyltransferase family 4 protein [Sphingobacteriaceae bacterium]